MCRPRSVNLAPRDRWVHDTRNFASRKNLFVEKVVLTQFLLVLCNFPEELWWKRNGKSNSLLLGANQWTDQPRRRALVSTGFIYCRDSYSKYHWKLKNHVFCWFFLEILCKFMTIRALRRGWSNSRLILKLGELGFPAVYDHSFPGKLHRDHQNGVRTTFSTKRFFRDAKFLFCVLTYLWERDLRSEFALFLVNLLVVLQNFVGTPADEFDQFPNWWGKSVAASSHGNARSCTDTICTSYEKQAFVMCNANIRVMLLLGNDSLLGKCCSTCCWR